MDRVSDRVLEQDQSAISPQENFSGESDNLHNIMQSRKLKHVSFGLGVSNGERAYLVGRINKCEK